MLKQLSKHDGVEEMRKQEQKLVYTGWSKSRLTAVSIQNM